LLFNAPATGACAAIALLMACGKKPGLINWLLFIGLKPVEIF